METQELTPETITFVMQYLNGNHQDSLLALAKSMPDSDWAEFTEVIALTNNGFDLSIKGNGKSLVHPVKFPQPVKDISDLRTAMLNLAQQVHADDGVQQSQATVSTLKASKYMKTLCNHFGRKVKASYENEHGHIEFPFGNCEVHAQPEALVLTATAISSALLMQVQEVVASHLVRFAPQEDLKIEWVNVGVGKNN